MADINDDIFETLHANMKSIYPILGEDVIRNAIAKHQLNIEPILQTLNEEQRKKTIKISHSDSTPVEGPGEASSGPSSPRGRSGSAPLPGGLVHSTSSPVLVGTPLNIPASASPNLWHPSPLYPHPSVLPQQQESSPGQQPGILPRQQGNIYLPMQTDRTPSPRQPEYTPPVLRQRDFTPPPRQPEYTPPVVRQRDFTPSPRQPEYTPPVVRQRDFVAPSPPYYNPPQQPAFVNSPPGFGFPPQGNLHGHVVRKAEFYPTPEPSTLYQHQQPVSQPQGGAINTPFVAHPSNIPPLHIDTGPGDLNPLRGTPVHYQPMYGPPTDNHSRTQLQRTRIEHLYMTLKRAKERKSTLEGDIQQLRHERDVLKKLKPPSERRRCQELNRENVRLSVDIECLNKDIEEADALKKVGWVCQRCTYHNNDGFMSQCDMCSTVR